METNHHQQIAEIPKTISYKSVWRLLTRWQQTLRIYLTNHKARRTYHYK